MIVSITDNGNGFPEDPRTKGFGLQLTKERIKLLNQTLNRQQITFLKTRKNDNTQLSIHFKNWLI